MLERLSSALAIHEWSARDLKRLPNVLSLSRLALGAVFPLTLGHAWWSFAVLAAAGATDVLDGWFARRTHQETALGAVVDAVADKLFVLAVIVTLVVGGLLSPLAMVLLGTRDIGEVALALRLYWVESKTHGRMANAGGKVTTLLQYAALGAIVFGSTAAPFFIVFAAVAGIVATVAYWHREVSAPAT